MTRYNCTDCGHEYSMGGDISLDENPGLCLECGARRALKKIDATIARRTKEAS